jgi:Transmembrane domain of unknown function (DUF3566)
MVTSRTSDDDLIGDQDTPSDDITDDITGDIAASDVMAPPRRPARKPASAKSAPDKPAAGKPDAGQDADAKDTPAAGTSAAAAAANGRPAAKEPGRPVPVDATVIDGIPALPADSVGSARGSQPKAPAGSGPDAGQQSGAGDSSVLSFGPPPSAPAKPAVEDPTIAYSAEAAAKPADDDFMSTGSSSSGSSVPGSSGASSSAPATEASSVPPAAFAWEMPDPPASSPSSPARAFLRSGLTAKNPAPAKAAPSAPSAPASKPAAAKPAASETRASGPVTLGPPRSGPAKGSSAKGGSGAGPKGQKAQQKAQSKRSARQAHLTVSRVEPWSVMKFSFVVSLVAFVILFVAVSVLYGALSGLGVFTSIQHLVNSLTSSQNSKGVNAMAWFSASRILGYTALLGSLNIVLITAMSTIGSVVYNLTSRLVGGVEVTLRETE